MIFGSSLLISLLLPLSAGGALHIQPVQVVPDSVTICVYDAVTLAPVLGAEFMVVRDIPAAGAAGRGIDGATTVVRSRTACARVNGHRVIIKRVGYRTRTVSIGPLQATYDVWLTPLTVGARTPGEAASGAQSLAVVAVTDSSGARTVARMSNTVSVNAARLQGVSTVTQLLERLPYTNVRTVRGESGVSLRGARREQVVITLNGMSLNDPSTGTADIADIPLTALGTATVTLGADPLRTGPGATGGVIALTSAAQRVLTSRFGTLGQQSVEGAWSAIGGGALWHGGVMTRRARNDFSFGNSAGASGSAIRETRVNNDESRVAANVGVVATGWQFQMLGTHADRGMVGPANVRANDEDRAITGRVSARFQTALHGTQVVAGTRILSLDYRDPDRPVLDVSAHASANDVTVQGVFGVRATAKQNALRHAMGNLAWSAGGGTDRLRATGGVAQTRERMFASTQQKWTSSRNRTELGIRVDGIHASEASHNVVVPSLSLATEHQLSQTLSVSARAAQAVRVPTLYDLYFSSPQRLSVASLRPERVRADLEVASHYVTSGTLGALRVDVAAVSRDTRDAIVWFPGNFGWSPANVGRETLRGMDGRIALVAPTREFSAWFTAYRADVRIGALRIPTPYVPSLAMGTQSVIRHRGFTGSLNTRTMGRRPFTAGPTNRDYQLPAVSLVDAAVARTVPDFVLRPTWSASLVFSVDNATNAAWQSVRGYPSPGRTWAIAITLQPFQTP